MPRGQLYLEASGEVVEVVGSTTDGSGLGVDRTG
jgi:hypothetical protein